MTRFDKKLTSVLFLLGLVSLTSQIIAQRVYERGPDLMLEDEQRQQRSLGPGFNAVPVSDHEFLLIHGARMGYGETASCERPAARNQIFIYNTRTQKESLLFNNPLLHPMFGRDGACVYEYADLSPSRSTLYIVRPCYATAGCLAIINLPSGKISYVPGAMDVFVIRGGSREGDLIYMCRISRKTTDDDPRIANYQYVHAKPDGSQIGLISDEDLVLIGGNAPAPILRNYLRSIHARIFVQGEWVP